jgi:hypothetical protein
MFDPYHKWLGIPQNQRPPTFYQLLGIAPDETDREVIAEASIRQTSHVRTYQTGPRAQQCIDLLNEIARARSTLLDPIKRKEYDASLKRAVVEQPPQPAAPTEVPIPGAGAPADLVWETLPEGRRRRYRPSRLDPVAVTFVLLYLVVLLVGGALAFWLARG